MAPIEKKWTVFSDKNSKSRVTELKLENPLLKSICNGVIFPISAFTLR